jgi:hypothetical protein
MPRPQRLRSRKEAMKAEIVKSDSGWDLIVNGYGWREIYADYQTIDKAVRKLMSVYPDREMDIEIILPNNKREEVI